MHKENPQAKHTADNGNDFVADVMPRCIYCNGKATDEMPLISVYAPGIYFQHWNIEKQKGCSKNKENISPSGQKINVA